MDEYISKQKVLDYLNDYLHSLDDGGADTLFDRGQRRALINSIQDILAIKVADAQPVKHGRWIDVYEYCEIHNLRPSGLTVYHWCSECDKAEKKTSDFCPNCGVRMDFENENTK